MTEKKPKKEKVKIVTRAPQKRGIFDNLGKDRQQNVKHPMSELIIFPGDEPEDIQADSTTIPPTYLPTYLPTSDKTQPISPERDFAKVPNSIKRAVEAGRFPNSSLAIYMYLYSLTRGAIQPKRSVRSNKSKLLNGANLRSEKALLKNLDHLKNIGLVKITVFNGDHLGNEFEVFVPEEIEEEVPTHLPTHLPTYLPTKSTQVPTVQRLVGRWVETEENKEDSDALRLSFKDYTNIDDEPFGAMNEVLTEVSKKVSGKPPQKSDREKWKQIAELLALELEIVAARTNSISNAPAFLLEHLTRRLLTKDAPKRKVSKSLQTGKTHETKIEIYQAESLSEEGRETVLKTMREFIEKGHHDFVMNSKDTYTDVDWKWLMKALEERIL